MVIPPSLMFPLYLATCNYIHRYEGDTGITIPFVGKETVI